MSVRRASKEEHKNLPRFEHRSDAHAMMAAYHRQEPRFAWVVRSCKRVDGGGYARGNRHYHPCTIRELTPDEIAYFKKKHRDEARERGKATR